MRDYLTSLFKKAVGVTEEHYTFIDKIRGKKSKAGKLKEIIDFYKEQKHL